MGLKWSDWAMGRKRERERARGMGREKGGGESGKKEGRGRKWEERKSGV